MYVAVVVSVVAVFLVGPADDERRENYVTMVLIYCACAMRLDDLLFSGYFPLDYYERNTESKKSRPNTAKENLAFVHSFTCAYRFMMVLTDTGRGHTGRFLCKNEQ